MKYAFFIDLEGTLLNKNNEINSLSVNYLKNINKDNIVTLVSSMSFNEINKLCLKYNLDLNFYTTNEGIYKYKNKLIFEEIDYSFLSKIKDGIYTSILENIDKIKIINYQERLVDFYPKKEHVETLSPIIITVSIFNEYLDELISIINDKNYKINVIGSDTKKTLLIISKNGLTKGNSINLINLENVDKMIAITDSINDKDLLDLCDIKIAMKNGDLEVKKYADIVTEFDNNNDGCMKELSKYI